MQLRKSCAELKLLAVNIQRTICPLLALNSVRRQTVCINTKEIAHACALELKITRYTVKTHHMDDILLHRTEDPLQHIVEMHADVGSYTAGLMHIAFP